MASRVSAPGPGRGRRWGSRGCTGTGAPERGWGIGSLSTTATVTVFVAVLAPVLAVSLAPRRGAAAGRGRGGGGRRAGGDPDRRGHHRRGPHPPGAVTAGRGRRGGRSCPAGCSPTTRAEPTCPGLLAPLVPLDVDDGRGGRHALLWDRRTGDAVGGPALLPDRAGSGRPASRPTRGSPAGVALLADLGYQPAGHPHRGHRGHLPHRRRHGRATTSPPHLDPRAPALARTRAAASWWRSPRRPRRRSTPASPSPSTRAAPQPRPADLLAAVVDVGRRLPGIETALGRLRGRRARARRRPAG